MWLTNFDLVQHFDQHQRHGTQSSANYIQNLSLSTPDLLEMYLYCVHTFFFLIFHLKWYWFLTQLQTAVHIWAKYKTYPDTVFTFECWHTKSLPIFYWWHNIQINKQKSGATANHIHCQELQRKKIQCIWMLFSFYFCVLWIVYAVSFTILNKIQKYVYAVLELSHWAYLSTHY